MSEIYIGEYLFRRLKELGVGTVFGVPGDYELALLDLPEQQGLQWVGTPNELIGAYAADGYARHKGFGALVTTFGPGELSALCGIGGSYCEYVPVVHIVGYPKTSAQASGRILHHTLGDGSYDHYVKMSAEISCATAVLKNAETATYEIDRVLQAILYHSRPGYIGISEDIAYTKVPASGLDVKLTKSLPSQPEGEATAVSAIISKLQNAQNPVIIVDGGSARPDWSSYTDELVAALKVPFFVTVIGKGAVTEASPLYGGAYLGIGSHPETSKAVESSDCVLWLGNLPSDFNTGMFTANVDPSAVIDFQRFFVKAGSTKYIAPINYVLPKLIDAIRDRPVLASRAHATPVPRPSRAEPSSVPQMNQDYLWPRLSQYLRAGDLIVTETGTSQFGFCETDLPAGSSVWTQGIYGSIGYAAAAAVGASVAAKETGQFKRMVLVTGEGSLQLTVQSFALLNRLGVTPVVFVLNNSGYTVERYFHGFHQKYNDVPEWDYDTLFKAFSPGVEGVKTYKVTEATEFDALLSSQEFQNATTPQCVEIIVGAADCPSLLKTVFAGGLEKLATV